jgi:hypothetical protein
MVEPKYCLFDPLHPVILADILARTFVGFLIGCIGCKIKFYIQHYQSKSQYRSRSEYRQAIMVGGVKKTVFRLNPPFFA